MTLVEFLRARLNEDEQAARECGGAPWSAQPSLNAVHVEPKAIADNKLAWGELGHVATVLHERDQQHIARHDPARVLREVEAKRRLIADFEMYDASARYPDSEGGIAIGLGTAVELAALAYADHPDYDEAWRPV